MGPGLLPVFERHGMIVLLDLVWPARGRRYGMTCRQPKRRHRSTADNRPRDKRFAHAKVHESH